MVASIAWDGFGRVTNADSVTDWTAVKITSGGPSPTIALADGSLEGAGAITSTSNNKRIFIYYDIGAGNELDFQGEGLKRASWFIFGVVFYRLVCWKLWRWVVSVFSYIQQHLVQQSIICGIFTGTIIILVVGKEWSLIQQKGLLFLWERL